jgi:hypothetical protein
MMATTSKAGSNQTNYRGRLSADVAATPLTIERRSQGVDHYPDKEHLCGAQTCIYVV